MSLEYGIENITIKNMLSKKTIAYTDLRSIRIDNTGITFTTKDGEETTEKESLMDDKENLYKAIRKYNIAYKNANESLDKTFTLDELSEKFNKIERLTHTIASCQIKSKYGNNYDIKTKVSEDDDFVSIYLYLTKDGEVVPDMGDFDDLTLAFLVEWDQLSNCGRYGVTLEMQNNARLSEAVQYSLNDLFEEYEPK